MAQTLSQLEDQVFFALGGEPADQFTKTEIVNMAGRHLYSMHQWRFAEREPLTLALLADQDYIELPSDFGSCIKLASEDVYLVESPPQKLARIDSAQLISGDSYAATLVFPARERDARAPRVPRFMLRPTPSDNTADAGTLYWRGGWVELVDSTDTANVPWYAENLLASLVRTFAKGLDEDKPRRRTADRTRSHPGWGHTASAGACRQSIRHLRRRREPDLIDFRGLFG
jgi:hypothetical protein